jgi:hypothetical protein
LNIRTQELHVVPPPNSAHIINLSYLKEELPFSKEEIGDVSSEGAN